MVWPRHRASPRLIHIPTAGTESMANMDEAQARAARIVARGAGVHWNLPGSPRLQGLADCASRAVQGRMRSDRVGIARPDPDGLESQGLAMAVAGGIGGDAAAGQAAAVVLSAALHDYYATPSSWQPKQALERVLGACNDWMHARNMRDPEGNGGLATLSVLVLRGGRRFVAHVGDCRIYCLRAGRLQQLTRDHLWPRHDMRHIPKRAFGLDGHLVVDYAEGEVLPGDVYLLVTDGVWEVLGDAAILTAAGLEGPADAAEWLVGEALTRQAGYMGRNDATAIVARVDG